MNYRILQDGEWTKQFRLQFSYRMDADVFFSTVYGIDPEITTYEIVPTPQKVNRYVICSFINVYFFYNFYTNYIY